VVQPEPRAPNRAGLARDLRGGRWYRTGIPVQGMAARRERRLIWREIACLRRRCDWVQRLSGYRLLPLYLDAGIASIRNRAKYSAGLAARA
jgi:hypothetical protein